MRWRTSFDAERDLNRIYLTSVRDFGPNQAASYLRSFNEAFETLSIFPASNAERPELGHGIRVKPHKAHVILYRVDMETETLLILRIRHGREDWQSS